ncbi:MAG TPA: YihY/virulence factor BrkB family protein [Usitatibacter sp.]|nr:YihY/virulence factor BrkB family protein [Usitatibacter sp.]
MIGRFLLDTLKAFRNNQGLLLAGAVAYYALLSIIPLLILILIVLSHILPTVELLEAMELYLGWIVPGRGTELAADLAKFVEHREVMGWVLLATMVFFSTLAFGVLESALQVIFHHRKSSHQRRFWVSLGLPYLYIVFLGVGALLVTLVSAGLGVMGERSIQLLGWTWGLGGLSKALLYLLGVAGEVFIITSIYMVMPAGRLSWRHALIGGATAALLWELTRHVLVWYFDSLSRVADVYGSLTTAIVLLLSFEIAAILLLLGAQVIAEYERHLSASPRR